jgi:serine/threonine protein kinase
VAPYDARSDVYSVGVTLYEMITGRLPYPHDDCPIFDVVLRQLTSAPPDIADLAPRLPAPGARLVMRCLAKDPAARPSLAELADGFATAVAGLADEEKDASSEVRPRPRPSHRLADQLAETLSVDAPTRARPRSSRPPPTSRRA